MLLLLPLAGAHGQQRAAPEVRLVLAAEQSLRAGTHAAIEVRVLLPDASDMPLLLTPSVEGGAIEVVRGRLSRADAKRVSPAELRFEIPVLARSEGTAILHVDLTTYVCTRSCARVSLRASQLLVITGENVAPRARARPP